jgi:asparagine N-glycosylation enzyme membrane subunit Stt3
VVAARLGRITGLYQPAQSAHLDVYLENTEQWVANLGLWSYYVLAGLAVAGAVVLRRRGETLLPLLAPIVTVLVTVAAFYAATRFRATAEGALCLLAAIAVDAAIAAIRRRSSPTVDAPTVPTADATVGGSV